MLEKPWSDHRLHDGQPTSTSSGTNCTQNSCQSWRHFPFSYQEITNHNQTYLKGKDLRIQCQWDKKYLNGRTTSSLDLWHMKSSLSERCQFTSGKKEVELEMWHTHARTQKAFSCTNPTISLQRGGAEVSLDCLTDSARKKKERLLLDEQPSSGDLLTPSLCVCTI